MKQQVLGSQFMSPTGIATILIILSIPRYIFLSLPFRMYFIPLGDDPISSRCMTVNRKVINSVVRPQQGCVMEAI